MSASVTPYFSVRYVRKRPQSSTQPCDLIPRCRLLASIKAQTRPKFLRTPPHTKAAVKETRGEVKECLSPEKGKAARAHCVGRRKLPASSVLGYCPLDDSSSLLP